MSYLSTQLSYSYLLDCVRHKVNVLQLSGVYRFSVTKVLCIKAIIIYRLAKSTSTHTSVVNAAFGRIFF